MNLVSLCLLLILAAAGAWAYQTHPKACIRFIDDLKAPDQEISQAQAAVQKAAEAATPPTPPTAHVITPENATVGDSSHVRQVDQPTQAMNSFQPTAPVAATNAAP